MRSAQASIGLVLSGAPRDVVLAVLVRAGFEVHVASSASRVQALIARKVVNAWIFDARSDDILNLLLATDTFLLPADNIPEPQDHRAFSPWVEGLLTQLEAALVAATAAGNAGKASRWSEVRGVWLLAGSAGATSAVQAFLTAFRRPPPVAFLYAQHLDPGQHQQLLRFTPQNTQFSQSVAQGVQPLGPGRVVMISPRGKVTLNEFGQLSTTREPWTGGHTPDINELLVILSAAKIPAPGVIIFSGMGDDGAAALRILDAAGGRIWAQSPASAVCKGMPQSALDTGLVQRSGGPVALARAMERLYQA